jgi:O-antigen ligase
VTLTTTFGPSEPAMAASDASEPPLPSGSRSSIIEQFGLSRFDALALTAIGLALVAYLPALQFGAWTARTSLLWTLAPLGLLTALALARRGDRAAILLCLAAVWTIGSALVSQSRTAVLGTVGNDLSTFTVVGFLAMWGIGRRLSARARELLAPVVIWAVAANGLIAVLQIATQVDSGPLALYYGRAEGLTTHPVYLGALCASALALLVARGRPLRPPGLAAYTFVGSGCMLSGSRAAVGVAVLTTATLLLARRDRLTAVNVAAGWLSLVVGHFIGLVSGGESSAAARVTADSARRTDVWRYGIEALGDRPLFGWGFGRFTAAVQHRFDVEFVRATGTNESTQIWFDPHNVIVGIAVATGVVGLALFAAWTIAALRSARGPLLWAVAPIAATWLVEPVALVTAPVALLMFGAAFDRPAQHAWVSRRKATAAFLVGAAIGGYIFVADVVFHDAVRRFDVADASWAAGFYVGDPVVADLVAQMHSLTGDLPGAVEWGERAVESQPDRPYWWTRLAQRRLADGDVDGAAAAIDESLRLRPVNLNAALADVPVALELGDEARLRRDVELACSLTDCGGTVDEIVADALHRPDD